MTDHAKELGDWAENEVCRRIRQMGGKAFKNSDEYDRTDDLFVVGVPLVDGPVQVKGKTSSTYRRRLWVCEKTGKAGPPREEHGISLWHFNNYMRRGSVLLLVEKNREVEPKIIVPSNKILRIDPMVCDPRIGTWKKCGKVDRFIYFARMLMQEIGEAA